MVRLQPAGPKRQAGGKPTGAADTWHLVAGPGRWEGHARLAAPQTTTT